MYHNVSDVIIRRRQLYLTKGKELLKQGKKSEAHDCFQKGVDISPEMALVFIKVTTTKKDEGRLGLTRPSHVMVF